MGGHAEGSDRGVDLGDLDIGRPIASRRLMNVSPGER
jgi:hypothetical protein